MEELEQGQEEPTNLEETGLEGGGTPEGNGGDEDPFDAAFSEFSSGTAAAGKTAVKGQAKAEGAKKTEPQPKTPTAPQDGAPAQGEEKPQGDGEPAQGEGAKPDKSALEEAEEAGKALAEKQGQAKADGAKGGKGEGENTAEPPPTTEAKAAGEAKAGDDKTGATPAAFPELVVTKIPEKLSFNGKEFPLADVIADYGEDVIALSLACGNAILQEAVSKGMVIPAAQFNEAIGQLQARVEWESHMNEISSLARLDARAVVRDPRFQEWVGKQNANIQLLYEQGGPADCAKVLKAFYATLTEARNSQEDAKRAKEKERREELHQHTVRDSAGRFAPKGDGGDDQDFASAFESFAQKQG